MEIQQMKQNLSFAQILSHYGLKPKNNMLNCPLCKVFQNLKVKIKTSALRNLVPKDETDFAPTITGKQNKKL